MPVSMTPFLRNVIYADILFSGAGAALMIVGASFLSPWLSLPTELLAGAGLLLVPWILLLAAVVRRSAVPGAVLIAIVMINLLWAGVSIALLESGWVAPSLLGIAFVTAQAVVVAALAGLEYAGLRQAPLAA